MEKRGATSPPFPGLDMSVPELTKSLNLSPSCSWDEQPFFLKRLVFHKTDRWIKLSRIWCTWTGRGQFRGSTRGLLQHTQACDPYAKESQEEWRGLGSPYGPWVLILRVNESQTSKYGLLLLDYVWTRVRSPGAGGLKNFKILLPLRTGPSERRRNPTVVSEPLIRVIHILLMCLLDKCMRFVVVCMIIGFNCVYIEFLNSWYVDIWILEFLDMIGMLGIDAGM